MLTDVGIARPRWPIIGRRSELEVFERALGSGQQAGLVIHGRAGVGKTRLADECAAQAAASGHPTERVAGSRTTTLLPLGAVTALLAGGLGGPGSDGQVHAPALFEPGRPSPPASRAATAPSGSSVVVRLPATRSVGWPLDAACAAHSSASRVFPTPARPWITRPACWPEPRARSNTSSSDRRPIIGHRGRAIPTSVSMAAPGRATNVNTGYPVRSV